MIRKYKKKLKKRFKKKSSLPAPPCSAVESATSDWPRNLEPTTDEPITTTIAERVGMGTRCRDCDGLPKVADAGRVIRDADGVPVQVMHNGLRVIADGYCGEWMTDLIRNLRGHHEPQEERIFYQVEKVLPADARMIELGAYWAYYSLWFLKDQPGRQAVAMEPDPQHLEVGQQNARLNGLAPVFRQGFAGASYAEALPFHCERSGDQVLARHSVESLMQAQGWEHLNLLHCDIQGAEVEVLNSCTELFRAGRIDWLFVSTHSHHVSNDPLTHQRCLDILRRCGAVIELEHDVQESFSGDGMIVARFCAAPSDWQSVEVSYNRHSRSFFRHLAYDLEDCRRQNETYRARLDAVQAAETLHPSLEKGGTLLSLVSDGPLGRAGDSLLLPDDTVISRSVLATGAWAPENIEAFKACLSLDRSYALLDIGANIGLFTRQLVQASESIETNVCIEPDPGNFRALKYNLASCQQDVEFHEIALGDKDECARFFLDSGNIGNYSLNPDAMRQCRYETVPVQVRKTEDWMCETVMPLVSRKPLLWKSDTQGYDELIIARTPWEIWQAVEVALIEIWRISKPDYDQEALRARLSDFPNRRLGEQESVSVEDIIDYLQGNDGAHTDLLLWR